MSLFADVCAKLGAMHDRAHLFSFTKDSSPGAVLRFTRDLRPLPDTGLTGGHLLELYAILDERHPIPDAATKIRFDVLEEDFLLVGGLDDRIISLLGTNAVSPEAGAPTRQVATQISELPGGVDVASFVEEYKRTITAYEDTILVLTQTPAPAGEPLRTRRTHLLAWVRVEHDDIGAHSEPYFVLDIEGVMRAASPILNIEAAPPGVSVRLRGSLADASPLDAATPEPAGDVPVTLGGRRAVTGPGGDFVIDARLAVGDHPLASARTGIDAVTLTVRVSADAAGLVTADVLDALGASLVTATTTAAATEQSVLPLAIPQPIAVVVHKLRGTVLWPDSRPGDVAVDYHGTPLAERRVYVLPVPAGTEIARARPRTTREWEALGQRADVLRSTRPGRPAQGERTDVSGRFEIRYVDYTDGNRFLVWVERFDPVDAADATTESPDLVVRTFRQELVQLTAGDLTTVADASRLLRLNRNLVDHEYGSLTQECVPLGVEALRVAAFPAPDGLSLVRPQQRTRAGVTPSTATRTAFETLQPLTPTTGDNLAVPVSRTVGAMAAVDAPVVGGLELLVLPLVPIYESADAQGGASRRAVAALNATSAAVHADYTDIDGATVRRVSFDAQPVRLVVAVSRLGRGQAVDLDAGVWQPEDTTDAARAVGLLESTLIVRPQALAPELALWHIDATSLGDCAFVTLNNPAGGGVPKANDRALVGTVHPVLAAVSALLPGLASRRVYLGPGHGLFPKAGAPTSSSPADWTSERGGYGANAPEDEVDVLLAAALAVALRLSGATVYACREIARFEAAGLSNPSPGHFTPVPDPGPHGLSPFPRRWQQNAFVHLGAASTNSELAGAAARIADVRHHALSPASIDLFVALHTNASNGKQRGLETEYLNVATAAGGEGNPLGRDLATRLQQRLGERLRTGMKGVFTMNNLNSKSIGDLTGTFDHWRDGVGPGISQQRRDTQPAPAWVHEPFPETNTVAPFTAWLRIPVALAEHSFHDDPDDAALLSRAWFRRLAADGSARAIDAQLQAAPTDASNGDVQAVLKRTFGDTGAVRALATAGIATPTSITAAVTAVAGPIPAPPATATLGAVATAALDAARELTRQGLADLMRESVRGAAGWEATDAPETIELWVSRAITGGVPLDRPAAPATRADAGSLACTAVGLAPASIATAETVGVGTPASALIRPAPLAPGTSAFLGRIEADALIARLAALTREDLHRVDDAYLADGAWSRLDAPPGGGLYELDPGTPLTVVFHTAGVPWKTIGQTGTNGGVDDVEIRVITGGRTVKLGCVSRTTRVVASSSWFLDVPPTTAAVGVTVELWIRHRTAPTPLRVGGKAVSVRVRAIAAA